MSTDTSNTATAVALRPGEGEALWFLGGLTTIKASGADTSGRVAVTENLGPRGYGSPLHVHRREDEWFYVIEGELTVWVDGETIVAPAGSFVYGPRDVPHTFVISSDEARFLLVAQAAGFEEFIRTLGEPADRPEIPPPSGEAPDLDQLVGVAASFGIEILGPPGIPE